MLQKDITQYSIGYEIKTHPSIKGMQIIEDKNNFPISWLNKQGYCEYQLYLEHIKHIETQRTRQMTKGSEIHQQLEDEFKKDSTPISFDDAFEMSKKEALISRECYVVSAKFGIRGFIDEIWMMPDEIVIIDDKPGKIPYESTMNQVRAYCLAYKDMTGDKRKIKSALRQRATDNIFWSEEFTKDVENQILFTINRIHGLFEGTKPFVPTKNPNKCHSCRFKHDCEHAK